VRGIVDGHVVMEREIADRGRYPAINVLKSISRAMPGMLTPEQKRRHRRAKQVITFMKTWRSLIRFGAYRKGSDKAVDESLILYPQLEEFLRQDKDDSTSIEDSFTRFAQILGMPYG
jgi:flagellum-specific ATP synthase